MPKLRAIFDLFHPDEEGVVYVVIYPHADRDHYVWRTYTERERLPAKQILPELTVLPMDVANEIYDFYQS